MTSTSISAALHSPNDACGAMDHEAHLQLGLLATSRWLRRHHQEPAQAAVETSRHRRVLAVPCLHMERSVPAHHRMSFESFPGWHAWCWTGHLSSVIALDSVPLACASWGCSSHHALQSSEDCCSLQTTQPAAARSWCSAVNKHTA